jgi:Na+-transporting NADH:ubiquinone oxidoreductase subunit A
MQIKIRKGLNIPLEGQPEQTISAGNEIRSVALLGPDTIDLKPRMEVREGERVRLGQVLFSDKQNPGVVFTSPGSGVVTAINRGERRVLQSVVVELEGDDAEEFDQWPANQLTQLNRQQVSDNLLASGMWTAFRTRPYSKIPLPGTKPASIFVTAMDSNSLAADPAIIIARCSDAFRQGLQLLTTLTDGPVYVCTEPGSGVPVPNHEKYRHAEFSGPHPAGLVGTHIHFLDPVNENKCVWLIGYPDVIAISDLFTTGRLPVERVVAIGGPMVRNPRLVETRMGASTSNLMHGEKTGDAVRVVSGPVLSGHRASGWAAYLGRYHNQVGVLQEGSPREFLSFMRPGTKKYSATRAYAAHLLGHKGFPLTTTQNGSPRAMVSIGSFERVMPLDLLPTPLLKALLVRDTDGARELGCLELDEEDLALCTFVCNGKYQYGRHLRLNLAEIEVNG